MKTLNDSRSMKQLLVDGTLAVCSEIEGSVPVFKPGAKVLNKAQLDALAAVLVLEETLVSLAA
jgi:hypothetical protein